RVYGRSAVAIASLARVAISAFWGLDARLVNGPLATFRASRMRVDTTTSDSGPVPRSHSPRFGSRLSRFIRTFLLPDQVAEPGRRLVILGGGGGVHLLAEVGQLGGQPLPADRPGELPGVGHRSVDPLDERLE